MRLVDAIGSLAPVLALAGFGLLVTRRRLVRRFQSAQATRAEVAIRIADRNPLARWWLGRLHRAGVLKTAAADMYWLDPEAWRRYRAARRRRALIVFGTALLLVLLVMLSRAQAVSMLV